jgi:hypothetical protein
MQKTPFLLLDGGGQPIEILQGDSETAAFANSHFGLNALALTFFPNSTDFEDLETAALMPTERPVLEKDSGSHKKALKLTVKPGSQHSIFKPHRRIRRIIRLTVCRLQSIILCFDMCQHAHCCQGGNRQTFRPGQIVLPFSCITTTKACKFDTTPTGRSAAARLHHARRSAVRGGVSMPAAEDPRGVAECGSHVTPVLRRNTLAADLHWATARRQRAAGAGCVGLRARAWMAGPYKSGPSRTWPVPRSRSSAGPRILRCSRSPSGGGTVPRGRRRVAVVDEPDPSRPRQAEPQVKP